MNAFLKCLIAGSGTVAAFGAATLVDADATATQSATQPSTQPATQPGTSPTQTQPAQPQAPQMPIRGFRG